MEVRVPLPIRALISVAAVATPLLALCAGMAATRAFSADGRVAALLITGPPLAVTLVGVLLLWRRMPVSRWIRAACVLVAMHALLIAAIAALWFYASAVLKLDQELPLAVHLPVGKLVGGGAVILIVATWMARPRRGGAPRWLNTLVRFLLVHLIALGLLVPLVAAAWLDRDEAKSTPPWGLVLVPTLAIALLDFHSASWRRCLPFRPPARIMPAMAIGGAAVTALVSGFMLDEARWVYANLGPLIVANALLALIAVNLLGFFHWLRVRHRSQSRGSEGFTGRIVADDPSAQVAWISCSGWMEGLGIESNGFRLRSPAGPLSVPAHATIVAELPVATIHLKAGDKLPILSEGESVRATGYVAPPADGPFRQSSQPVPSRHVMVQAVESKSAPRQNAILAIWRPCCLYLAAATIISIPGIIASLTFDTRPHTFVHERRPLACGASRVAASLLPGAR